MSLWPTSPCPAPAEIRSPVPDDDRRLLEDLYRAAVAAVDPVRGVSRALTSDESFGRRAPWILALGKAGTGMCRAAIEHFESTGRAAPRALVVTTGGGETPSGDIELVCGDHPVPGRGSFAAAERIASFIERVSDGDEVLVLLSGGTSSLVAAPVEGVSTGDLTQLFKSLLGSGADIAATNAIRKRFSRWAAGRLAVALAERGAAPVHCLIISDVIGDDPAVIASGPCVPDPLTAQELLSFIEREGLQSCLTPALRNHLDAVVRGELPETPKPDDAAFRLVTSKIILGNRSAREGASARAHEIGLAPVKVVDTPIQGDASLTGEQLVKELVRFREASLHGKDQRASRSCVIWGGETTVHLGPASPPGGRNQELALAAAHALHELGERAQGLALLAAGSDGRDGPTDAAGAVADASTWRAIASASRNPARDLAEHESHASLGSVRALLHSQPTGTNVGDVVIGLVSEP
jgi:hydroxypyruvate reductase